MNDEPDPLPACERFALQALALLRDAQRDAARGPDGTPIPLHAQDRRLWDRACIAEALALVDRALDGREVGVWTLRAAIAAVHAQATDAAATDWHRIGALTELLAEAERHRETACF
jgi:RNA polymerase sigma-70 factor, ECF subfamily